VVLRPPLPLTMPLPHNATHSHTHVTACDCQTHHFEACHWGCRAAPGAVVGVVGVCRERSPGLLYSFDRPFRSGCFAFARYQCQFGCRQGGGLRWPVVAESSSGYPPSPTPHALGSEWCVPTLPGASCVCVVYVHRELSMSSELCMLSEHPPLRAVSLWWRQRLRQSLSVS